jgi:hypothetical protein
VANHRLVEIIKVVIRDTAKVSIYSKRLLYPFNNMAPKRKQNSQQVSPKKLKKVKHTKMEQQVKESSPFQTLPITLLSGFLVRFRVSSQHQ